MRTWTKLPLLSAGALLLATVGCHDDTNGPTDASPAASEFAVAMTALVFWQIDGGSEHTCGVTMDHRAYCWGMNRAGELGNGTAQGPQACEDGFPCSTRPVAVGGGLRFQQVSAGADFSCGITPDYRAYCWGLNANGQLGDGTTTTRLRPVAVLGGLRFRQIDAGAAGDSYPGWDHTCGVTYPDNRAYCWGHNGDGQLGDGTRISRSRPVAVAGGLFFKQVSAGGYHTCGTTLTAQQAYCWGGNGTGQLGDSTQSPRRLRPTRVAAGARRFRQINAGRAHTCAVSTTDRAFCWGYGGDGQLGTGKTYVSFWPRAVAGGLSFARVTAAGYSHTCGETTLNQAYCWGYNGSGQLGNGSSWPSLTPTPVAGGLRVKQMSAGSHHTCAKNDAGLGYCWGNDWYGQLGDGMSSTDAGVPTAVLGPR